MSTPKVDMQLQRTAELERELAVRGRAIELEASLEKIRSRSLGMHNSSELKEVITVVLQTLEELGVAMEGRSAVITVFEEGVKDFIQYRTSPEHSSAIDQYTPYFDSPILNDLWNARAQGEKFYTKSYPTEEKNDLFRFYFKHTELRHLPENEKIRLLEREHYEVAVALEKNSGVIMANLTAAPLIEENHQILRRFATVFEQAYIRFLDLQRAEAHAREAKIEAALERVRARTMAMQHSSELGETSFLLVKQIKALGIDVWGCAFNIFNEEEKNSTEWFSNQEGYQPPYKLPREGVFLRYYEAAQRGDSLHVEEFAGEKCAAHYRYLSTLPILGDVLKQYSESGFPIPTFQIDHVTYFKQGYLLFITQKPVPESYDVFKRFATVFEQTYTRFLDLQKAEAQAREAQIEAALERIRARAMAMQNSEELTEVAKELRRQIGLLEAKELATCAVHLYDESSENVTTWAAMQLPSSSEIKEFHFSFSKKGIIIIEEVLQRYAAGAEEHVVINEGEKLVQWMGVLQKAQPEIHALVASNFNRTAQFRVWWTCAFFPGGALIMITMLPPDETAKPLLRRFAQVFGLAYRRFADLKTVEAQAIRAAQDLIEIKAAKKKAEDTLAELRLTQQQLIQKEKMASLGELMAGIAHEIQNPLNFVSNFSEVSKELVGELKQEVLKGNSKEAAALADDVLANLDKVVHHGKRADAIVKGMLQHSKGGTGVKEPTDVNQLTEEYLQLAFHGFRGKEKDFTTVLETHFDHSVGKISVVPQDLGRVLLNLFNNAFYAVLRKKQRLNGFYEPVVSVSTKNKGNLVIITVSDNGTGMSQKLAAKVFQPFFTTKPTGEGTGLGLSLSYDIITKGHGGSLSVHSTEGEGAEFVVELPA